MPRVSWSPWHFSGQNYGLSLMFMRRRGVAITKTQRRLLYASFWLSFTPAFVVLHAMLPAASYVPLEPMPFETFRIIPAGIPWSIASVVIPLAATAYLGCLVTLAVSLLRAANAVDLVPSALIVALQSMWFVVPGVMFTLGFDLYASIALMPIALSAAHSVQHLWVSSYYTKREQEDTRLPLYLVKATLAGATALGASVLLFAPDVLGSVPFDSGLALLAASILSLHHFIIDGAIWKLRDGRVAHVAGKPELRRHGRA